MPLTIEQSIKSSFNDVDSFTKKIENYTHVFIHGIESEEEKIIKEVFENEEIKTDRLYKVEKENHKIRLKLEKKRSDFVP